MIFCIIFQLSYQFFLSWVSDFLVGLDILHSDFGCPALCANNNVGEGEPPFFLKVNNLVFNVTYFYRIIIRL